jgi:curli biogenesis system outer membrane secretion channel CsgG
MRSSPRALLTGCLFLLGGCVNEGLPSPTPTVLPVEKIALPPPPQRPLAVGVYGCIDTTGQRRPTGAPQELSSAVPLDCSPYLIDAIQSLSPGYVYLVERGHVDDLLRERQLATLAMNTDPPGAEHPQVAVRRLATLRVAEILLVGQVVAYDRATKQVSTGLAIGGAGGDGTLVTDLITFSLRAVAVQTGQVLGQTTATKSVTSLRVAGHSTQIFSASLLEFEIGAAGNEAVGLALSAAVRSALGGLINQGIHDGWWS